MHLQPVFKACRVRGGAVREINSLIKRSAAKLELIPWQPESTGLFEKNLYGKACAIALGNHGEHGIR
jgi:hypothetical protein